MNKIYLGYDQEHVIKISSSIAQEDVEKIKSWYDASKDTSRQQKNHKKMKSSHLNFGHPLKMKDMPMKKLLHPLKLDILKI